MQATYLNNARTLFNDGTHLAHAEITVRYILVKGKNVKVKVALQEIMKTQRASSSIILLFL
jgi:hypothetical protein